MQETSPNSQPLLYNKYHNVDRGKYSISLFEEEDGTLTGQLRTQNGSQTFTSDAIECGVITIIPNTTLLERIKTLGQEKFMIVSDMNDLPSSKKLLVFQGHTKYGKINQRLAKRYLLGSEGSNTPTKKLCKALSHMRVAINIEKKSGYLPFEDTIRDHTFLLGMLFLNKSLNGCFEFLSDEVQVAKCREFISTLTYRSPTKKKIQELLDESNKAPYALYLQALFYELENNKALSCEYYLMLANETSFPFHAINKAYEITKKHNSEHFKKQAFLIDQVLIKILLCFNTKEVSKCFVGSNTVFGFDTLIYKQLKMFLNTIGIESEKFYNIAEHVQERDLTSRDKKKFHLYIAFDKRSGLTDPKNLDTSIVKKPKEYQELINEFFIESSIEQRNILISASCNNKDNESYYNAEPFLTFHTRSSFTNSYRIFQLLGPLLDVPEEEIKNAQDEFLVLSREILSGNFNISHLVSKGTMSDSGHREFIHQLLIEAIDKDFCYLVRDLIEECRFQQWKIDIGGAIKHLIGGYKEIKKEIFHMLMAYLNDDEIDLNTSNFQITSLFRNATKSLSPIVIGAFLEAGADPNTPTDNDLHPLSFTFKVLKECKQWKLNKIASLSQIIELLLQYGANIPEAIQSAEKSNLSSDILKELNMLFGRNTKSAAV